MDKGNNMSKKDNEKSLTVFKSDRHEDIAAIILAMLVVACVLVTMAFVMPSVTVHAESSGIIGKIVAVEGAEVKKGDLLYTIMTKDKIWKGDVAEEVIKEKQYKAKTNGKITAIYAHANDKVSKNKTPLMELQHEKGTLP